MYVFNITFKYYCVKIQFTVYLLLSSPACSATLLNFGISPNSTIFMPMKMYRKYQVCCSSALLGQDIAITNFGLCAIWKVFELYAIARFWSLSISGILIFFLVWNWQLTFDMFMLLCNDSEWFIHVIVKYVVMGLVTVVRQTADFP